MILTTKIGGSTGEPYVIGILVFSLQYVISMVLFLLDTSQSFHG